MVVARFQNLDSIGARGTELWPSKVGTSLLVMKVLKLTHALKRHLKNTQYDQDELQDASS